jgi:hypothetical protein
VHRESEEYEFVTFEPLSPDENKPLCGKFGETLRMIVYLVQIQ